MIAAGALPKCVAVGIDNAGAGRGLDYLPNKPGAGPQGMRQDAANWPGGGSASYLAHVAEEILPAVQTRYGTTLDPSKTLFGGSSFGGISALQAATTYPALFGRVLCESPSLWVEEGRLLERACEYDGALPERMFLGMGGREYTDRYEDNEANRGVDAKMASWTTTLRDSFAAKGMGDDRLKYVLEAGAIHNEGAWARRFPVALDFLLGRGGAEARSAGVAAAVDGMLDLLAKGAQRQGHLAFLCPSTPTPGQRVRLYVNRANSPPLARKPNTSAKGGFDGWRLGGFEAAMAPAESLRGVGGDWWVVEVEVPRGVERLDCVFHDGGGGWENNCGADFHFECAYPVQS
uniref:Carbohydrate binding module family 25 domain-containing protein n=1 Tax=Tetraselmis chuii TaxID=63592 RepID=A0A7S1SQX9_9CHLO|mmetsp:Transcript_25024/g.44594  ORF Transcript_25024/g.44594 Transcript_25024/m.44594 type:complete len:347 (+) Transcript_25024:1203-2243(+)